jgi:hypothetical protein
MDLLLILLVVGAIIWFVGKSTQQGRLSDGTAPPRLRRGRGQPDPRMDAVRRVASEDVTQLGEQLQHEPIPDGLGDEALADWQRALDAYENAKGALDNAQTPEDLQWVTRALDDGRFALATLRARRAGHELPSRRGPCFFDQRHGISVQDSSWAPPGGAPRDVPVCAACATRIADGISPDARTVPTAAGERPYWEAGPEYGPWARGWYGAQGAYLLNGMLVGTMLGTMLWAPMGYGMDGGFDGGDGAGEGGDVGGETGGDLGGGGDVGGGFGEGGGFGDFGGFDI